MRKKLLVGLVVLIMTAGASQVSAQKSATGSSYKNAVGLGIEFGNGGTGVGPTFKHFFTDNHAGVAEVLFADGITFIQAFYQYHKEFEGAAGLRWFAGGGPGFGIAKNNSAFLLRPMAGLDYKINGVPLCFSFDWRPWLAFADGGSDFEAGRLGLGIRYAFN